MCYTTCQTGKQRTLMGINVLRTFGQQMTLCIKGSSSENAHELAGNSMCLIGLLPIVMMSNVQPRSECDPPVVVERNHWKELYEFVGKI